MGADEPEEAEVAAVWTLGFPQLPECYVKSCTCISSPEQLVHPLLSMMLSGYVLG